MTVFNLLDWLASFRCCCWYTVKVTVKHLTKASKAGGGGGGLVGIGVVNQLLGLCMSPLVS